MCLLKTAEPVCECIFEQTKHLNDGSIGFKINLLSYLSVSRVIPPGKHHSLLLKSLYLTL